MLMNWQVSQLSDPLLLTVPLATRTKKLQTTSKTAVRQVTFNFLFVKNTQSIMPFWYHTQVLN